jgi:hypothetical protein
MCERHDCCPNVFKKTDCNVGGGSDGGSDGGGYRGGTKIQTNFF